MTTKYEDKLQAALHKALADVPVTNEDGEQITGFVYAGLDSKDHGNISRHQLERLLRSAYEAGYRDGAVAVGEAVTGNQ